MLKKIFKPITIRYDKIKSILSYLVHTIKSLTNKHKSIREKIKIFKNINQLNDFQKLILLTIIVCLPAGIIIAIAVSKFFNKHR